MARGTTETTRDVALDPIAATLRWTIATALIVGSFVILGGLVRGNLGYDGARLLVSLAVVALGATFLLADRVFPRGRRQQIIGGIGAGCTLVAVVVSVIIIWTDLLTNRYLWKTWWFFSVASVHTAHVLAILRARTSPRALVAIRNITLGAAVPFAAILALMTFREDVLSEPGTALSVPLYVLLAVQAVGSVFLWIWARPRPIAARLPRRVLRVSWLIAVPVLVFAGGFYFGRVSAPRPSVVDQATSFLAGLPSETVERQIQDDVGRLKRIVEGVERLRAKSEQLHDRLQARRQGGGSRVFTPEEDDDIRALFFSFLSYRSALLRMVAFHHGFSGLDDTQQRARCFLVGYTAGAVCYSASLDLVSQYADDDLARKKLNEAESRWEIPGGMFDRIQWSAASERNIQLFEEMTAYHQVHRSEWRNCGLDPENLAFLGQTIEHAVSAVTSNPIYGQRQPLLGRFLEQVKRDAYKPVYVVQSLVSTWIGDTRLVSRRPCIAQEKIEEMRSQLEPGDIILERRNWFLSNAFLPGFWPHAALYVGTLDDLKELGIADEPEIRDRRQEYESPAHDGEAKVVIESISEGVSFSSLGESTGADYVAILRPRLSREQKARAILTAFSHQGKPYDFEFDFFSSDKLVCTELVYRCYEGMLHFGLVEVMGRATLPAVEIARKHRDEKGTAKQQLDFVLFLDTPPGGGSADFVTEKAFLESVDRPRAFNE